MAKLFVVTFSLAQSLYGLFIFDFDPKVRFSLPKDNHNHNPRIRRARNYLKSDWEFVAERPSVIVKEERYEENFSNFDDGDKTQFQFDKSVTITTGNDYTLTKSFDVSVNANIPVGIETLGHAFDEAY